MYHLNLTGPIGLVIGNEGEGVSRLVKDFDYVLSLDLAAGEVANPADVIDADLDAYELEKIEERKAAKKEKDFAKADAIRNELLEKGIVLEDTREGVKWKKA